MATEAVHYSPKQVASALAASESSVKRWCDRGIIPTVRTHGGHRRISLDGLRAFTAATGKELVDPQVLGLPQLFCDRKVDVPGAGDPCQSGFRKALAVGDEATCRNLLFQKVDSSSRRSLTAAALICDAMQGIGDAWDCKELDPYQERRACDICIRLINELRSTLPSISDDAPVAIGGGLCGDPYQLPTALVELTLREQGWNAISIGTDLPAESFLQAAHDFRPRMVWLSVSAISHPDDFVVQQNRLADGLGEGVALVVGGRALSDAIRPQLKYTAFCDSLQHLDDLATMIAGA
ncbi:B12 binding domain protein [Rubripirellula obstinata]|uniref:B12 binding domain protein n=1 Tax=Rubripirellula obstinata TaxID=406547 RepID=A0A5B1CE14_9BACT|nr:helix-turn-helix domain-containing protein [Rubripirellula obstinata]KAA1257703.1 B12 binding domain protein [Rubripirellula obstinata]